jgi:hypothetical protein
MIPQITSRILHPLYQVAYLCLPIHKLLLACRFLSLTFLEALKLAMSFRSSLLRAFGFSEVPIVLAVGLCVNNR